MRGAGEQPGRYSRAPLPAPRGFPAPGARERLSPASRPGWGEPTTVPGHWRGVPHEIQRADRAQVGESPVGSARIAPVPTPPPLLLAVPNVSEGRDRATIDAIGAASAPAQLLDVHVDPDHGRSV